MQHTRTQAQNEQLPVQHFDKIRHHCPIIAKSFLAFIPRLKPWAFPPGFCNFVKPTGSQKTSEIRYRENFWIKSLKNLDFTRV